MDRSNPMFKQLVKSLETHCSLGSIDVHAYPDALVSL